MRTQNNGLVHAFINCGGGNFRAIIFGIITHQCGH